MKINAIRIKNLASLEGTTEIDFTSEPLASAGIFAITGPTGAGKSTLLDALCLSLYGKTPRYLQAKEIGVEIHDVQGSTMSQGDVRGILRDGTSEGFAAVDFIGTDGQNYCATWSVRRARNKADGSLQADAIALKNTSTNLDLPGKKAETYREIERLVGLNFEQFTRSVLLAQGDFTAFMKASKDEKSSLLEKLTGTHIYSELSKKVFENYRIEERKLHDLNLRKEGIATLTEEAVLKIKEEEITLGLQITTLSKEIDALNKELQWHEQFTLLGSSKEAAVLTLQQAKSAVDATWERKEKLVQIEAAQTLRSGYDALCYNEKQLAELHTTLATLKEKLAALVLEKTTLTQQFLQEEVQWTEATSIQKEAVPQLAEARRLDTLLSEKEKQLAASQLELHVATEKRVIQQKEVAAKELELTQFNKIRTEITAWQTKYSEKKNIAENKDLIVSKLTDAEQLVAALKTTTAAKKTLEEQIEVLLGEIKVQELDFEKLESAYKKQKDSFETASKKALLIPIEALQMQKDATDSLVTETVQTRSFWTVFTTLKTEYLELQKKQVSDEQKEEELKMTSAKAQQELATAKTKQETSELLLKKARLVAAENVQLLRANLQDNEPCPVCGSEAHPYALHNPQLDSVLEALEKEHLQNSALYLNAVQEGAKVAQELKGLQTIVQQQSDTLVTRKAILKTKETEWKTVSFYEELQPIADEEKSTWIENKIKQLKATQLELYNQIKVHADLKKQLELDKSTLEALKENSDKSAKKLVDYRSQLALYNEQASGVFKQLEQTEVALGTIQNSLSPYFNTSDWMEHWKKEPAAFVTKITDFAALWKQNTEQLESNSNQEIVAAAALKQLNLQLKDLDEALVQKTEAAKVHELAFAQLKKDRNAIYKGQPAAVIETKFADAVVLAHNKLELVKANLQNNTLAQTKIETQSAAITTNSTNCELEIKTAKAKMETWLSAFNEKTNKTLTFADLTALLQFSLEWVTTERKALQTNEEALTKATTVLLERTDSFQKHLTNRPSERLLEDLKTAYATTKNTLEVQQQAKANIGFQLTADAQNKSAIGHLLKDIETQTKVWDNWIKLNDSIGSADGKKFRQIAQEHTLEVLLSYANIHLNDLTNRYRIERIPNTLGLQVVDLDMGDEIRTVYSLSGGESFLVSLALALGLASLSSSKMKVESLFIDEGFGSLDPNTLNVAMDALERLYNQGRKVGVISHVQEMTERIPVQIKVSKKSSGKSLVEVVGYGV
jgi:exonuclease SbcC